MAAHRMPRRGPRGAAERNFATHTFAGVGEAAHCTDCGCGLGDPAAVAPCPTVKVVTIPIGACICEGRVTTPRRNCWATTHDLKQ